MSSFVDSPDASGKSLVRKKKEKQQEDRSVEFDFETMSFKGPVFDLVTMWTQGVDGTEGDAFHRTVNWEGELVSCSIKTEFVGWESPLPDSSTLMERLHKSIGRNANRSSRCPPIVDIIVHIMGDEVIRIKANRCSYCLRSKHNIKPKQVARRVNERYSLVENESGWRIEAGNECNCPEVAPPFRYVKRTHRIRVLKDKKTGVRAFAYHVRIGDGKWEVSKLGCPSEREQTWTTWQIMTPCEIEEWMSKHVTARMRKRKNFGLAMVIKKRANCHLVNSSMRLARAATIAKRWLVRPAKYLPALNEDELLDYVFVRFALTKDGYFPGPLTVEEAKKEYERMFLMSPPDLKKFIR